MRKIIFIVSAISISFIGLSQRDDHSKFFIKFSPTQLVSGELHFAYEQRVSPQSSLEFSFGPTVSEVGINQVYFNSILDNYTGVRRESNLGLFAGLAYRYYPLSGFSTAPRGLYIAPEIKFRLYNTNYIDEMYVLSTKTGSTAQFLFRFHTGFQFVIGRKFAIDIFTAVGLGATYITRYKNVGVYNNSSLVTDYKWRAISRNKVFFSGTFGVKFGIGGNRKDK